MQFRYLIILLAVTSSMVVQAQYSLEWARTYGANTWDEANCVVETADSNLIVAGTMLQIRKKTVVMKLDRDGNVFWERYFGDKDLIVEIETMALTKQQDVILAGASYERGKRYDSQMRIMKLDTMGNLLWDKTYGGEGDDRAENMIRTSDNNFVIIGYTKSNAAFNSDIWLTKIDTDGNVLWQNSYGNSKNIEVGKDVAETYDKGLVILGNAQWYENGNQSIWVIKVDENGAMDWHKLLNKSKFDFAGGITSTFDSSLVFTGFTKTLLRIYNRFPNDTNAVFSHVTKDAKLNQDILITKLDRNGNELWSTILGEEDWDEGTDILETSDGGIAVAAFTKSYKETFSDFRLIKLDPDGYTFMDTSYMRSTTDYPKCMIQTHDKGLLMVGGSYKEGRRGWDLAILKYSNDDEPKILMQQPYEFESISVALQYQILFSVRTVSPIENVQVFLNGTLISDDWLSDPNAPVDYLRMFAGTTIISRYVKLRNGYNTIRVRVSNATSDTYSDVYRVYSMYPLQAKF